jgi:transposase
MEHYVALDVSLREISVCVMDGKGAVLFEGKTPADPEALVTLIRARAPHVVRVGLETGSTSPWLFHALTAAGFPAVCMDARQAHAALSMRPSKSDRSDARGLADMLRMGWFREVHAKSVSSHERRTLLGARHQLVTMRTQIDAQMRGMLKTVGLVLGTGNSDTLIQRAEKLTQGHPVMSSLVARLAEVRRHIAMQVAALDREIRVLVRSEPTLKRLMTVPGIGPITALAFLSAVDDPARFKHARDVGPYLGLTPTRYQSGQTDRQGRISKCGDRFVRTCLYEAAGVLLTRVQRFSPLKAWGLRLAKRIGGRKARIAVARKLAVIMHCIWTDGTEFWWSRDEASLA